MSINETTRLDPLAQVAGANAPAGQPESEDSVGFRRLLESLERLAAEHRKAPAIADAGSVEKALAKADEGFSLAMDLRRHLEDAFRQRQP